MCLKFKFTHTSFPGSPCQAGRTVGHLIHGPVDGYFEVSFKKENHLCHRNKKATESVLLTLSLWLLVAVDKHVLWAACCAGQQKELHLQSSFVCPCWTCFLWRHRWESGKMELDGGVKCCEWICLFKQWSTFWNMFISSCPSLSMIHGSTVL